MKNLYSWSYFDKLEKNKPQIGRSINDTVTALNAGERQVAAGADGSTLFSASRGNPLAVSYPTRRLGADHRAVGDHEGHQASQRRQALHGVPLFGRGGEDQRQALRHPARPEVPSPPGAKPISEIKTIRPTVAEIDKGIPEVIEQWRDTFGN